MSMENDMTAKIFGRILAEGMSLADCHLEDEINSVAISALKDIKKAVSLKESNDKKLETVEKILKEYEW